MRSGVRILFVTLIAWCMFSQSALMAEPVRFGQVQKVTDTFLKCRDVHGAKTPETPSILSKEETAGAGPTVAGFREIRNEDGAVLAYVMHLQPRGFVATSADTDIAPVVAYSLRNSFPAETDHKNPLYRMLREDMRLRTIAVAEYPEFKKRENNNLWDLYSSGKTEPSATEAFQQWPEEGTTSTGGWLETAWHQSSPYNDLCPVDPVGGSRSVVGCVATAMAQVVNYHQQCTVQFDELDSYGTLSGIDIDADSELYDFPSFEELNDYLAAVRLKYSRQMGLGDTDVAALSFACGVAIFMDYSSEGSGASPYDIYDALTYKFRFHSADMTGGLSREYDRLLQENVINRLPVLLGLSPPDGYGGHVVVCDGYNTNGEYHLNFGWGASRPEEMTEVWYRLPSDLPSCCGIISETILNVLPVPPSIIVDPASLTFHSVPHEESESKTLYIKNNTSLPISITSIWSPGGFFVSQSDDGYGMQIGSFVIERPGQEVAIFVKFSPRQAGGYYGTLTIEYGDGSKKNVILEGYSFEGGTQIPEGEVSGTWSQAESPYFVAGDIEVAEDAELIIEPGVQVMFLGPYGMTIGENARLAAEGDENHPIEFTAWNRGVGWGGLRFVDSGDDDILSHCSITYSIKGGGPLTEYDYLYGGGDEGSCGGALYCEASSPIVTNCKITDNVGDKGGAIYCLESYPVITNTVIANNASLGGLPRCGGICTEGWGAPEITNCTIANNAPGAVFTASGDGVDMTNTIVWGNETYQIQTDESVPVVSFCDVQGGYPGEGNIDADPCLFAPSSGPGPEYDGSYANWTLQSCSPCINSGTDIGLPETDLAGDPRIYSDIVDLGAYENQSDLPLITITPSGTVDAGYVQADPNGDSMFGFDVTNTGKIEFSVRGLSISDANGVFSVVTGINEYLLAPGDSVRAEIGFAPIEERVYTGVVTIDSTCSNAPQKQIPIRGVGVSGTIVSGGEVSGTWSKAGSPYTITGDVHIPRGRKLIVGPGVVVRFAGHFRLTVGYRATLEAIGTETDHVIFTSTNTSEGWFGIRFVNSGADDTLKYCTIEYANKPYTGGSGYLDLFGGAILCCGSWEAEPSFLVPSSPTIEHCLIANNHAFTGAAIMCMDESEAVIAHNTIVDNSGFYYAGGIDVTEASPTITNNVIAHNSALLCGGVMNWFGAPSIISNTIANNRPNGLYLEMTMWLPWDAGEGLPVLNNIIWENEIYLSEYAMPEEYDIRFNNIQGGAEGEGNIDVDPCFAGANNREYHVKSEVGRWDANAGTWVRDDVTSPCIDAGDPEADLAAELRPHGGRINMGAFGGTMQASLSDVSDSNLADLNEDNSVDYTDVTLLVDKWLDEGLLAEDIDRSGTIGFGDFCMIADSWLREQ